MPRTVTRTSAALAVIVALAVGGRYLTSVSRVASTSDARLTGDEVVYLLLGDRLWHEGRYTTQGIERLLPLQRTVVPAYLHADVFKHPPLFPALVGMSRTVFGGTLRAAYYPNLLFAAISIVTVFVLCRELTVGPGFSLLGATFMAVSPLHWIASSQIWLDLPLATLVSVALLLHLRASRTQRWGWVGLAWGAAALTKAVAAVPWFAAMLVSLLFDPDARRSRRFWYAHAAVAAALVAWFMVLTTNEGAGMLVSRASAIDDARTLVRILPYFLAAVLAGAPLIFWWNARASPDRTSAGALVWLACPVLIVIALVGGLGPALVSRPWTGWDANPLVDFGAAFYFVYPVIFDPIVVLGLVGLLLLDDHRGALVVRGAWLGLIVFLTAWGNYQTRYSLPLLFITVTFATSVLSSAWSDPRTSGATRALLAAWVALSITRSLWVVRQLWSHDFFYF